MNRSPVDAGPRTEPPKRTGISARARPHGRARTRAGRARSRACSKRCASFRATYSSTKRWPAARMKTQRCRSAMGRRFRSRTSSRAPPSWHSKTCPTRASARVLEVGTGCGYAAAVLAQLFGEVVSVERLRALHERARENLRPLRLSNLRIDLRRWCARGGGRLHLTIALSRRLPADEIPPAWIEQLKVGGRIVAPMGTWDQQLTIAIKDASGRAAEESERAGTLRAVARWCGAEVRHEKQVDSSFKWLRAAVARAGGRGVLRASGRRRSSIVSGRSAGATAPASVTAPAVFDSPDGIYVAQRGDTLPAVAVAFGMDPTRPCALERSCRWSVRCGRGRRCKSRRQRMWRQ